MTVEICWSAADICSNTGLHEHDPPTGVKPSSGEGADAEAAAAVAVAEAAALATTAAAVANADVGAGEDVGTSERCGRFLVRGCCRRLPRLAPVCCSTAATFQSRSCGGGSRNGGFRIFRCRGRAT